MQNFRQQAIDAFLDRFGEPELSSDPEGTIYRWRLKREDALNVHIIIDSPEIVHEAHVLVSDPHPNVRDPVRSIYMRTMEDVMRTLEEIEDQWRLRSPWLQQAQRTKA